MEIVIIVCSLFSLFIGFFLRPMAVTLYITSVVIGIGAAGELSSPC